MFKQYCWSGSGSMSLKYGSGSGSGSGSFHHQVKIVRKTFISTVLWLLYDFLSLKNDVNVPVFRIRTRRFRMFLGLPDPNPDPLVRGMDLRIRIRISPQHCVYSKCRMMQNIFVIIWYKYSLLYLGEECYEVSLIYWVSVAYTTYSTVCILWKCTVLVASPVLFLLPTPLSTHC